MLTPCCCCFVFTKLKYYLLSPCKDRWGFLVFHTTSSHCLKVTTPVVSSNLQYLRLITNFFLVLCNLGVFLQSNSTVSQLNLSLPGLGVGGSLSFFLYHRAIVLLPSSPAPFCRVQSFPSFKAQINSYLIHKSQLFQYASVSPFECFSLDFQHAI